MTATKNTVATMQQFNALVERADRMTHHKLDRLNVVDLWCIMLLIDKELAYQIRDAAIELGLWRH